jgi:hypothetical protein
MRTEVIYNLGLLGTNAYVAVPTRTRLLQDPDPAVRYTTKEAIRRITAATNSLSQ